MGLSSSELAALRRELETLDAELRDALTHSADAARPIALDQASVGRVSRIDAIQQQKMVEANRREQRARLQLIHAALVRLDARDEDAYGVCLDCGEDIAFARLEARPETRACLACQSARERGSRR